MLKFGIKLWNLCILCSYNFTLLPMVMLLWEILMHTLGNILLVMLIVNLLWTGGKVGFWATGSPNHVSRTACTRWTNVVSHYCANWLSGIC